MASIIDFLLSKPDESLIEFVKSKSKQLTLNSKMIDVLREIIVANDNTLFDRFMELEFDINDVSSGEQSTMIMYAAQFGRVYMTNKLLEAKADIGVVKKPLGLRSALYYCMRYGEKNEDRIECARMLIMHGSDVSHCKELFKDTELENIANIIDSLDKQNAEGIIEMYKTQREVIAELHSTKIMDLNKECGKKLANLHNENQRELKMLDEIYDRKLTEAKNKTKTELEQIVKSQEFNEFKQTVKSQEPELDRQFEA
jgi:ankyrin repeat protein